MRWLLPTAFLSAGLACGGLPGVSFDEDAGDEAELARRAGDFALAESILQARLREHPGDARSHRLLGDVNLTRGQLLPERWRENLGWAQLAYLEAVKRDPSACVAWSRLAAAVVSGAENAAVMVSPEALKALPLAAGWQQCGGAALFELTLQLAPVSKALTGSSEGEEATAWSASFAAAHPAAKGWIAGLELGVLPWTAGFTGGPPRTGPFVVLSVPETAASLDGKGSRKFTHAERIHVSELTGSRAVFLDRRFSATIPKYALTRASACPGTKWSEAVDHIPTGQCVAGPHNRLASDLYDPALLKTAGKAFFHEPDILIARVSWDLVADTAIRCTGGPVGRRFIDEPSCQVAYDRAVPQRRTVAVSAGLPARNESHANRIVAAARSEELFGAEVASRLSRGEVAIGMPFTLWSAAAPDLSGCKGRGVFQKLAIEQDGVAFSCVLDGATYTFRELALVAVERP